MMCDAEEPAVTLCTPALPSVLLDFQKVLSRCDIVCLSTVSIRRNISRSKLWRSNEGRGQ